MPATNRLIAPLALNLDPRALAAARALLGLILLCASLSALGGLTRLYGPEGWLPPEALAVWADRARLSLHLVNSSLAWTLLLLLVQMTVALALLFGWRARLAAALACLLTASLANRNPLAVADAASWLSAILLWAAFLPLSARASVDAALSPTPPSQAPASGWAALVIRLQLLALPAAACVGYGSSLPLGAIGLGVLAAAVLAGLLPWSWAGLTTSLLLTVGGIAVLAPAGEPAAGLLMVVGAVLLLPGTAFDVVERWQARRRPAGRLRIYFDRDCAFCERSCRILRELLLLADCDVVPAQSHPRADALRNANRSWVVIDRSDRATLKWAAMRTLLHASPLCGWLLRPLPLRVPEVIGNRIYDFVADHRAVFARTTAFLAPRQLPTQAGPGANRVAGLLGALMLAWQLGQLGLPPGLDRLVSLPVRVLNLDTARITPAGTAYLVREARLQDGRQLDPQAPEATPGDQPPPDAAAALRYQSALLDDRHAPLRQVYARWWCRRWNAERPEQDPQHMRELWLLERSPGQDGGEQRVILRHACTE